MSIPILVMSWVEQALGLSITEKAVIKIGIPKFQYVRGKGQKKQQLAASLTADLGTPVTRSTT